MDAEDNTAVQQQQPDEELAGNRSSLGDFSQQETAFDQAAAKKKRRYIIGGSIGLISIIIAVVLGVTLSGSSSNNANSNSNEEEQSNIKTENEPPILTQPNVGEEPTTTEVVDPTIFSINDDTATYFTNGQAFNMAFDEDNAVYISVLDNDASGNADLDLVVTSIKESTFGPKHGECIISMGLDEVVYELNDVDFIGEDQVRYNLFMCT